VDAAIALILLIFGRPWGVFSKPCSHFGVLAARFVFRFRSGVPTSTIAERRTANA